MIYFNALDKSHFPLIHAWFNKPHVEAFYSLKSWTLEEVDKKLSPHLRGEKQIQSFIVYLEEKPIAYIQCYPVKEHPWEGQELPERMIQEAAGLDLFIGEEEYLHRGVGKQILEAFLKEHIWPHYRYCIADPNIRNVASLRLFQKCGFKEHKKIETLDALKRKVELQLCIKERPERIKLSDDVLARRAQLPDKPDPIVLTGKHVHLEPLHIDKILTRYRSPMSDYKRLHVI